MSASLRPMLPTDGPVLAALFRDSIEILAADDYDAAQRDAWASAADDQVAFAARLAGQLTLVAVEHGEPIGFASLKGADHVDMLFVAPDHARQGVATLLLDALLRLAGARGASTLTVDASDTARDLFAARGFVAVSRRTVPRGEVWLGQTQMKLTLVKDPPA